MTKTLTRKLTLPPDQVAAVLAIPNKDQRANRAAAIVRHLIEWPEDVIETAKTAAEVTRKHQKLADDIRSTRDVAGMTLIKPYLRVRNPYDETMAKIDADLEDGKIDERTAELRRVEARATYRARLEPVEYMPIDVYTLIGVSRGLFFRMIKRMPVDLEDIPDAHEAAESARRECEMHDVIALGARTIRDEAVLALLEGNPKAKRPPMSNADVMRLIGLSSPRVHQIRMGTR
jgi:hypothetical protein